MLRKNTIQCESFQESRLRVTEHPYEDRMKQLVLEGRCDENEHPSADTAPPTAECSGSASWLDLTNGMTCALFTPEARLLMFFPSLFEIQTI